MNINWTDALIRGFKTAAWAFIALKMGGELPTETPLVDMQPMQELIVAIIAGIVGWVFNALLLPAFRWLRDGFKKDDD